MLLNDEFYGFRKVQLVNLLAWSRWCENESTLQRWRTERPFNWCITRWKFWVLAVAAVEIPFHELKIIEIFTMHALLIGIATWGCVALAVLQFSRFCSGRRLIWCTDQTVMLKSSLLWASSLDCLLLATAVVIGGGTGGGGKGGSSPPNSSPQAPESGGGSAPPHFRAVSHTCKLQSVMSIKQQSSFHLWLSKRPAQL